MKTKVNDVLNVDGQKYLICLALSEGNPFAAKVKNKGDFQVQPNEDSIQIRNKV